MMRRAERRAWAALSDAEGSWDLPPDGPVIQTGGLFAAGARQQGKDRGQAPPELAGTVQRGNQNVPTNVPDPGYKISLFCR
jgi:hypothetical protein